MVQPLGQTSFQPAVTAAAIHLQAAASSTKGSDTTSSITSTKDEGGFVSMLFKPCKMVGEFVSYVFKSLLCCCFYGRDLKADLAAVEKILTAKPKDDAEAKAVVKEFQALPSAVQKDVAAAYVNAKVEGVDMSDAKAVAEWKALEGNSAKMDKWTKKVTDIFAKKDAAYAEVEPFFEALQAVAEKYTADLKPATESK